MDLSVVTKIENSEKCDNKFNWSCAAIGMTLKGHLHGNPILAWITFSAS